MVPTAVNITASGKSFLIIVPSYASLRASPSSGRLGHAEQVVESPLDGPRGAAPPQHGLANARRGEHGAHHPWHGDGTGRPEQVGHPASVAFRPDLGAVDDLRH